MSLIIKHIGKLLVTSALALSLVACVTVTESRITKKASPEKAVENYTELGLGYLERNRPDLARKRIEKALSIDSKYAPANDVMGLIWQSEGEFELAEEFFLRSMKQDKSYTRARHHLGNLYLQMKQYERAEQELDRAAKNPYYDGRALAYNDLALMYYRQNRLDEAIDSYGETLRLSMYNVQALVNISTLYFEKQDYQKSQHYFDRLDRVVNRGQTNHTAHSLWLGIQLATINQNTKRAISLASVLKRNYPESNEYKLYQESLSGAK